MISVLLLGATGFLGGTVLSCLEKADYSVTSLVRQGKEGKLNHRKTRVIIGDFAQLDLLETYSSEHDVVINAATSDDLDLTKAINRGLAKRKSKGEKAVLVHVSGTQLIESTEGSGCWEDVPEYDAILWAKAEPQDSNLEQINGISDKALHRYIDLEVKRADLSGEVIASIICPGLIFGVGAGPDKIISDLNPDFVRVALTAGKVVYAGDGKNEWPDVHVQDVADMIMLSLEYNLKANEPAGFERFYFAENGSHQKLQHAQAIAKILYSKGYIRTDTPESVPAGSDNSPSWANRTTSRCIARRPRRDLDWKPKFKMADVLEDDVLATVKSVNGQSDNM